MVARSADDSFELYHRVKSMPRSTTRAAVSDTLQINVNGPVDGLSKTNILSATGPRGKPLMVKLLRLSSDGTMEPALQKQEMSMERDMADRFGKVTTEAFVPMSVETVFVDKERKVVAIIMPRYVTTVAKNAQSPLDCILTQGKRILRAVQCMHAEDFVHMDIKPDNIFINQEGAWYLGDFGSSKKVGDAITSCTEMMYPRALRGKPAKKEYDIFMLGLTVLIAADLAHFKQLYSDDNVLEMRLVAEKLSQLAKIHAGLCEFASNLLKDNPGGL